MDATTTTGTQLITCDGCGTQVPYSRLLLRRRSRPALHRQLHHSVPSRAHRH